MPDQSSKTFGNCPLCDEYGPVTQQHVRLISGLKGCKVMICRSCHEIVTRYEDEIRKIVENLGTSEKD